MLGSALPTTGLGRAASAAVVWRQQGALSLTAILKASFSLVPEGRMALMDPDPISPTEQPDPSGRGLRSAGDLAPYLGQVDVWLTGHAEVPPQYAEPHLHVRLSVVQGGEVRIDKQLTLDASVRAGPARAHIPIRGLDPISRQWPVRRNLIGDLDPRRLEGPILDLPDAFDWRYFHTVPADQRLEALTGDEWIILGGMVLRRPRLRTQLPGAQGAARLYRREQPSPRAGEPIALRADMLQIDVDRLRCAIVWRGHVRIRNEAELEGLHLVAGVEMPGQPLAWADPFPAAPAAPPPRPALPAPPALPATGENPLEGTMIVPSEVAAVLRANNVPGWLERGSTESKRAPSSPKDGPPARPAPPPRPPAAPRAPVQPPAPSQPSQEEAPNPIGSTFALSAQAAAQAASALATPFVAKSSSSAPPAAAPALAGAPVTAPAADEPLNPIGSTMALSKEVAAKVASVPATPFSPAPPSASRAATPQSATRASAPSAPSAPAPSPSARAAPEAAPSAPAPAGNPLEGTMALSNERIEKLSTAAATPFESKPIAPPPPPPAPGRGATPVPARPPVAALDFDDDLAPPARVAAWNRGPGEPTPPPPPPPRAPAIALPPPPPASLGASPAPAKASLAADLAKWPPGLGAEFLAAMAEAGALGPPPDRASGQSAAF